MIDLRPVVFFVGALVAIIGVLMLAPMAADLLASEPAHRANWTAFALSAVLCVVAGGGAAAANAGRIDNVSAQQGFLLLVLSWTAATAFSAMPLSIGIVDMTYTDAFFEAMSGITTTGSTVVVGLDDAPPGFLLWRAMLQWLGGIGVVIMAIAAFPMLRVGGMQLFRMQSTDTSENIVPRARKITAAITAIYAVLTVACFFSYWSLGMPPFDAVAHAMTTIATGGFSTRDASFGYFLDAGAGAAPLDLVCVLYMIAGSLPFALYLAAVRGSPDRLFNDSQVRFFLYTAAVFIFAVTITLVLTEQEEGFTAFRLAAFNIVSIMTGTGYASTDYTAWGPFSVGFFFCVMFVGGCAGSTSCGLKIFRFQVALSALSVYGRRLIHPHGVFRARYNGRILTDDVFVSVLSFFFVYFASFATVAVILSAMDLDPLTALSAAGTAIANVGPGLGERIGPAGTFEGLPDAAKWVLSFAMLLGRLEFFALLVLFSPNFWRR